jgi:hypothetical protein
VRRAPTGLGFALLIGTLLSACVQAPRPAPLANQTDSLPVFTPIPYAQLPGWAADNPAQALAPFIAGCARMSEARLAGEAKLGGSGLAEQRGGSAAQWQGVCDKARTIRLNDEAAARAFFDMRENIENLWLQNIAAGDDQIRRRATLRGFFHHGIDRKCMAVISANRDHAIEMRILRGHFFHGNDIAAVFFVRFNALCKALAAPLAGQCDHIGQKYRKGFIADNIARAPDRMAKAQGSLLAGKAGGPCRGKISHQRFIFTHLTAFGECIFELIGHVEMVFDDGFVAAGHKDKMFNPGFSGFIHAMLQDGPIDDG